ncbi:glycoside hydrolase family 51 protein [Peniophora sp. CONT]|nr:glycoside hydrolase family 51 protein [Peniophora sp. CONT]
MIHRTTRYEWGVWDELVGTPENSLQQRYDLRDALAFGAWLNVLVGQSASIGLACLAQTVHVIAPLNTRLEGVLHHPTYDVLCLSSQHMRDTAVRVAYAKAVKDSVGRADFDGLSCTLLEGISRTRPCRPPRIIAQIISKPTDSWAL